MYTPLPPPDDRISDEFTELEFGVSDPGSFFVGLSHDAGCLVRLEELIRLSEGDLLQYFSASDCPPAAVHDRADRIEGIGDVRIVGNGQSSLLFRIVLSGRCIAETIEDEGGVPRVVRAVDGNGEVIAHVPQRVDTNAVIASVLREHPTADLLARREGDVSIPVFAPRGVAQVMWDRLTDRQEEVLRTAYRNGYFERPRGRTGEEISDMLGISSATFSQHLRAAQANLFSFMIEGEAGPDDT